MTEQELPWPELWARLRAADQTDAARDAAWKEAARRLEAYARALLGAGRTLDAASADDVVQQTLLKLLRSPGAIDRIDPNLFPEGFFKTAIHNTVRDLARRKVVAMKALRELAAMRPPAGPAKAGDGPTAALREEVGKLSEAERRLLRMRFWEGLSLGEVARRLGEPYSRVAVRLFRLLQKLKRRMPP